LGENLVNLLHCSENLSRHVAEQCIVSNLSRKISQNEKETTIKILFDYFENADIYLWNAVRTPLKGGRPDVFRFHLFSSQAWN